MSNEVLQAIADLYIKDDPEDAGFYTLEWVQKMCASRNKSPEKFLADLQEIEARRAARPVITENQPWTKDLPAHMVMKLSGPIDSFSYELMEKSGELAKLNAAMDAQEAEEKANAERKG
jgi:hypothetical protein